MTADSLVWWFVAGRAFFGLIALVLSVRMMQLAFEDRVLMRARGINGLVRIMTTGQVRESILFLVTIALMTSTSWLTLPFVASRGPYDTQQVVASGFMFLILFIVGLIKLLNFVEYKKLVTHAIALEHGKPAAERDPGAA